MHLILSWVFQSQANTEHLTLWQSTTWSSQRGCLYRAQTNKLHLLLCNWQDMTWVSQKTYLLSVTKSMQTHCIRHKGRIRDHMSFLGRNTVPLCRSGSLSFEFISSQSLRNYANPNCLMLLQIVRATKRFINFVHYCISQYQSQIYLAHASFIIKTKSMAWFESEVQIVHVMAEVVCGHWMATLCTAVVLISCQFWDCKVLLVLSSVNSSVASVNHDNRHVHWSKLHMAVHAVTKQLHQYLADNHLLLCCQSSYQQGQPCCTTCLK